MMTPGNILRERADVLRYDARSHLIEFMLLSASPVDPAEIELLPDRQEVFYEPPTFDDAFSSTQQLVSLATYAYNLRRTVYDQEVHAEDEPERAPQEQLEIPTPLALADQYMVLEPFFQTLQAADLQPEVVIYRKTYNLDFWSDVMQGHDPGYKVRTVGSKHFINNSYRVQNLREVPESTKGVSWTNLFSADNPLHTVYDEIGETKAAYDQTNGQWGVAVVSGRNAPMETNISPNGGFNWSNRIALETVRAYIHAPDSLEDEQVFGLASPSVPVYLGLQWLRLLKGKPPVDIATQTFLQESLARHDDKAYVTGTWAVNSASVSLPVVSPGLTYPSLGIRPTVTAQATRYL